MGFSVERRVEVKSMTATLQDRDDHHRRIADPLGRHRVHPNTNLAASTRRWRLTLAAVVDSAAEQRSEGWACWHGNAAGLGGWVFVTRTSLTTLQATA